MAVKHVVALLLLGALSILAVAACGSSTGPTVRAGVSGAEPVTPTSSDLEQLATARMNYDWGRPLTYGCKVTVTPSTVKMATETGTGTTWAIATIKPMPGTCLTPNGTDAAVYQGRYATDVFEKPPGGPWRMNNPATYPFPCGPTLGEGSGPPFAVQPNLPSVTNPPGVTTPTVTALPPGPRVPVYGGGGPPSAPTPPGSTTLPPNVVEAPGPGSPTLPLDVLAAMGFQPNPACLHGVAGGND